MKTFIAAAAASILMAFSGAAFADETAVTTPEMVNAGKMDDTGMKTIGIDITKSEKMAADAEARIKTNCGIVVANKANANAAVLKYCQTLTGTL